jgi:hypothetical protein
VLGITEEHFLTIDREFKVDQGGDVPFFCKIPLVRGQPPLMLKFRYDECDQSDPHKLHGFLTMYGSFTHQVPSPKDFEFTESGRPTLIKIKPKKVFDRTF